MAALPRQMWQLLENDRQKGSKVSIWFLWLWWNFKWICKMAPRSLSERRVRLWVNTAPFLVHSAKQSVAQLKRSKNVYTRHQLATNWTFHIGKIIVMFSQTWRFKTHSGGLKSSEMKIKSLQKMHFWKKGQKMFNFELLFLQDFHQKIVKFCTKLS